MLGFTAYIFEQQARTIRPGASKGNDAKWYKTPLRHWLQSNFQPLGLQVSALQRNHLYQEYKDMHKKPKMTTSSKQNCPSEQGKLKAINIAVSSRALFKLESEHEIFEKYGLEKYIETQRSREEQDLEKGTAYPFITVLEKVNAALKAKDPDHEGFEVILMSHNHSESGIRIVKGVQKHDLQIKKLCLSGGTSLVKYLKPYNVNLFLTSYEQEVMDALAEGVAAAKISYQDVNPPVSDQLRIAFDLDKVIFSSESDDIYQAHGLSEYIKHERDNVDDPLGPGPLKEFAAAIGKMQRVLGSEKDQQSPIRTYIITARSAAVAERALLTLRLWGLVVDESFFLSGSPKGPILEVIRPHIFFDDTLKNIEDAQSKGVPAGHVSHAGKGEGITHKI